MLQLQLNPFPELYTERLILREPSINDATSLFEFRSDEEVMRYVPREPAREMQHVVDFISMVNDWHQQKSAVLWCACRKEDPMTVIGTIGFWKFEFESYRTELGYMLHRQYQKKGFMSEAIHRVLEYGFNELNLHSVEARVDSENISSVKVLEKIGFVREGYLRECSLNKGQFRDNIIFSLLRQNYS